MEMEDKGRKIKRYVEIKKSDPNNEMFEENEVLENDLKRIKKMIDDLDEEL